MIHPLLLSLAPSLAALQGAPLHADLHPAEADLFLEVGKVGALLDALDSAPILHFLRDERVRGLLDEIGIAPEEKLRGLLKQGLERAMPEKLAGGWFDGLGAISVSLQVRPGSEGLSKPGFLVLADLDTAAQAEALRSAILSDFPERKPLPASIPGVELVHGPDQDLWCVVTGTRLVVGDPSTPVDGYVSRSARELPGLTSREGYKQQLAALDEASGIPVLWFVLGRSMDEMLSGLEAGEGDPALAFLGQIPADLNPFGSSRVARMQFIGGHFVTEIVSSEPAGVAPQPVDPAWLELAPEAAMILYSSTFDGAGVGKRAREFLTKDEAAAASLVAIEQKLGYGPERVLARLGPGLTLYSEPVTGLGPPEMRAWIDCDDPAAFTSEYEALINALGESLPGFEAKTKPYKVKKGETDERVEVPVTTLTMPPGAIPIPMFSASPSYAPVGKKLVVALNSMDVKKELKRIYAGGPAEKSLLAAHGIKVPADARSVFVMDWAKFLGGLVSVAKAVAPMIGPEQLPFDFAKLPPLEMFAQYFKPTILHAKSIDGGIHRRNEASFGPETWFGLFLGVRALPGGSGTVDTGSAAPPVQEH